MSMVSPPAFLPCLPADGRRTILFGGPLSSAGHHCNSSPVSSFRVATSELVPRYSGLSWKIQKQRDRRGLEQGILVKALQNDSNYAREEHRWIREEQRWLREEQRWLREEKRWEATEARLTEANQALHKEVGALRKELEELGGRRGYREDITDVSLKNLVAGMRNLLQALSIPDSEDLPLLDNPEVLKQIPGTVPLSEGSSTTIVVGRSEPVIAPVSFVASADDVIAVVTPRRGQNSRNSNPRSSSPTQSSVNSTMSANGATNDTAPTTASSRAPATTAGKRTMKSGMEGDDVKILHDVLSELGFYSGEEDIEFSVFSGGTDSAVKTWQSSRGVPEDGIVTRELMADLLAEVAANVASRSDGAKSKTQPTAKAETIKPKKPAPEAKQTDSSPVVRKREIDKYERSNAQETGTGSSRRVYLLGENRWEEPGRLQKKQEEERRLKTGEPTKLKERADICFACRGVGTMLCTDCEGTGDLNVEEQFLEWSEEGEAKCPYCEGSGAVECDVCLGASVKVQN